MKNYFAILEVSEDAGLDDIKRSFRRLAKMYHPDRNKEVGAKQKFIEINEAYEYLIDPDRREFAKTNGKRKISKEEIARREQAYRMWYAKQQQASKNKAQAGSEKSFNAYKEGALYKTANIVSKAYSYIFLGVGLIMAFAPITGRLLEEPHVHQKPIWNTFPAIVLGLLFLFGIYRTFFKSPSKDA